MSFTNSYQIEQVVDLLGLDGYGHSRSVSRYNIDCPFCGRKKKLNINIAKNVFRCPACSVGGGPLKLYQLYTVGDGATEELKESARQELREALNMNAWKPKCDIQLVPPAAIKNYECEIADDLNLDKVYSALLALEAFKLDSIDKAELIDRGMTQEAIIRNQYRSLRDFSFVPSSIKCAYKEAFQSENWGNAKSSIEITQRWSFAELDAGLYIAELLLRQGLNLRGVPGFFKFGTRWCFRILTGMYIPVRNITGKIVGLVVHEKSRRAKYMIQSTSDAPEGTKGTTRIHFPFGCDLDAKTILVVEGILKGDVTADLLKRTKYYKDPIRVVAVHGVDSITEIPDMISQLHPPKVIEAYDMDKLTKQGPRRGSLKLRKAIKEANGPKYVQLFWDKEGAVEVLKRLEEWTGTKIPGDISIFSKIARLSDVLNEKDPHNKLCWQEWPSAGKGFDDFLRSKLPG